MSTFERFTLARLSDFRDVITSNSHGNRLSEDMGNSL